MTRKNAAAEEPAEGGELVPKSERPGQQATRADIEQFAPDRVARDADGVLRPARLATDTRQAMILMPDGTVSVSPQAPVVIERFTMADVSDESDDGSIARLPYLAALYPSQGSSSGLPDGVRTSQPFIVRCDIVPIGGTVPQPPGATAAAYDILFAVPVTGLERVDGQFRGLDRLLGAELAGKAADLVTGAWHGMHLWRATARRLATASPQDFAILHRVPKLDDALLRLYWDEATSFAVVPLLRAVDGMLQCVTGHLDQSLPGAHAVLHSFSEAALSRDGTGRDVTLLASRGFALLASEHERAIARARRAEEETATAVRHHEEDIERIAEEFHEAADRADLCSQYDDAVAEVNRYLHRELPPRMREYDVEVEVTYRVTQRVTAADEDDVEENIDWDMVYEQITDSPQDEYNRKVRDTSRV